MKDSGFCRHHQGQAPDDSTLVRVWAGAYPQHTPWGIVQRGERFMPTKEWLAGYTARRLKRWIMTPQQWEAAQTAEV
jgi:hypothetical protein